jgi:predicted RNA binding protein YcfA (HicA-like mRNA interferase family)
LLIGRSALDNKKQERHIVVMTMSGKECVKLLKRHGWDIDHIEGSHYILKKGRTRVSVPVHGNADMKPGTLNSILKEAGLK